MSILKKIKDKTGTIHDLGDSRVDAFETELSGAAHNVPYSPAVLAKTNAIETSISNHVGNTANPHKVTKAQIGLANVENKSSAQIRSELTKENVTNALGYTPIDESRIGAANGVASLDASGRIPASQIPGGFDNIEEYDNRAAFPTTGEEGKIYVAKDTNLTYRWTGSQYVEISPSLALGETATTAYRGDRGKEAYDHSQVSGNSTIHHTHANKELLDSYTQTEADLANAVAKVHEHGNKDVLDGITSDKVNSWDGKEDAFDVLPTTKGGTGTNAASKSALTSTLINSLSAETSTPKDADYYVSQHEGGGTSNTTYVRRPVSALWEYIKGKISSVLGLTASAYSGNAATATKPAVTTLTSSDNLNNVGGSTAGDVLWYKWESGSAPANVPIAGSAVMEVVRKHSDKYITQTVYPTGHIVYRRECFDGTWSSWYAYSKSTHTHGNITSGGALQTTDVAIANGDKLVITDSSDSSKVARASIAFDGSTTTKALTPKGTFEAFAKSGDITTAIQALDVSSVGGDGKYISAISETDGKISATATTMDTTPTANSTNAVTSGGVKTAIDTVDAKGIVINEIDGENVICFE